MPSKAAPHGAPARRYLNEKVTGVLLEGMKRLAAEQYVHNRCHEEIPSHETNRILWAGQIIPYKYLVNIYCSEVKTWRVLTVLYDKPPGLMRSCIAKVFLASRRGVRDQELISYNRKCQVKFDI